MTTQFRLKKYKRCLSYDGETWGRDDCREKEKK